MLIKVWWISSSSKKITAKVATDNREIIIEQHTAPIFKKFIGQKLGNLRQWLKDAKIVLITTYGE